MKLVSEEEIRAHTRTTLMGGIKGMALGTAMSLGIYALAPRYYPRLFSLPWSIRTAVFIIPPVFTASVNAELCSNEFDYDMYSSEASQKRILAEHRRWEALSPTEKIVETLSAKKYAIITGLWGASMWGSWVYVNRDPLLTKTQKFVTARMYAQFLTVGLLLASIGLSMYEENLNKKNKKVTHKAEDEALEEALSQQN
ncbi:hypothetical protein CAS74_004851 [Pichia kudriavzevii]|uniref:Respiratory supercomplex factor 2, mitochondrial n=1 Tax=Pichia kudriavzevii TaxID=4909 RepID=A0A099P8Z4_PICKU|nr:uncharacterized protein C5L36_0A11940 [Pichia kudriavzevii]AWU74616.1 hypothetical protein C5L36_0A11940 [Pichia kudriavzevii]KGK40709.1 hypothetical protein JL09_g172 [Pichia kudriavzevii]ONH71552.1 Respiratory supercomplex factor 2, mitochondrial [Pichia kudriavzevii]OUT20111.1 hypothetical protein CAS74_004851 [Pichia kudriavzevii]